MAEQDGGDEVGSPAVDTLEPDEGRPARDLGEPDTAADERREQYDEHQVGDPLTRVEVSVVPGEPAGEGGRRPGDEPAHVATVEPGGLDEEGPRRPRTERDRQRRERSRGPAGVRVDVGIR
jgi:hypothetical protein